MTFCTQVKFSTTCTAVTGRKNLWKNTDSPIGVASGFKTGNGVWVPLHVTGRYSPNINSKEAKCKLR